MRESASSEHVSPWRRIFEAVRTSTANRRDEHGILGSINWLRKQMELRKANPNVVRNIIYRDKGRLEDKRALFSILDELWQAQGNPRLHAPELEAILSPAAGAEAELMQLLGREKMQVYRKFLSGIRSGSTPRMLITGRPGSGKTLLTDTIQQALVNMPEHAATILRLEFCSTDLVPGLMRLAAALGVDAHALEARLIKIGASSAYAVQADAQADVARLLSDALRQRTEPLVALIHVSQSLGAAEQLAGVPLRLNTPDVPRVRAGEWLWQTLFEPLSRLPGLSLLVSLTEVPARVLQQPGGFEAPVKLNPPTVNEARRFVKARLPQLGAAQQEALVQRSGRSFEELRTLTLLAEMREPLPREGGDNQHLEQLSRLVDTSGDDRLREFLGALAVLSAPEFTSFPLGLLAELRPLATGDLSSLEQAFLDPVPARQDHFRAFSRQLARSLRREMQASRPDDYRTLNLRAAEWFESTGRSEPRSEEATRYLHHLFEAREWHRLQEWMKKTSVPQTLLQRIWAAACAELVSGPEFESVALQVATHYVKLGSYNHPDVLGAFEPLMASDSAATRSWTVLKQAEGAALRGQFEHAESLLEGWVDDGTPLLRAEAFMVRASIARWRGQLSEAARLLHEEARPLLPQVLQDTASGRLLHAKVAIWAGLVAKDQGDMAAALKEFTSVNPGEDLIEARLAYQQGDVLLRLGQFDEALRQLNLSVELARRSEALVSEQTRFISRRGMLHGMRGELDRAAADFRLTRSILLQDEVDRDLPGGLLERDFWLARSTEDQALVLLAAGEYQDAIFMLTDSLSTFGRYGATFGVETAPRILRSSLYLALAYYSRGLQQPFRFPLLRSVDNAVYPEDVRHARTLLDGVWQRAEELGGPTLVLMRRDCLLLASLLAEDPAEGPRLAIAALDLAGSAYDTAQGNAYLAMAWLRQGDSRNAIAAVEAGTAALSGLLGPDESSDTGLRAWLTQLGIRSRLGTGDLKGATELLQHGLSDSGMAHSHQLLVRTFGDAFELVAKSREDLPRHLLPGDAADDPVLPDGIRLPDALVARWLDINRQA